MSFMNVIHKGHNIVTSFMHIMNDKGSQFSIMNDIMNGIVNDIKNVKGSQFSIMND